MVIVSLCIVPYHLNFISFCLSICYISLKYKLCSQYEYLHFVYLVVLLYYWWNLVYILGAYEQYNNKTRQNIIHSLYIFIMIACVCVTQYGCLHFRHEARYSHCMRNGNLRNEASIVSIYPWKGVHRTYKLYYAMLKIIKM